MAREITPEPASPADSHIGARDELVRLLNERADNDVLAYYLLPLVRGLIPWGNCATALSAVIGGARYILDTVWGDAYDLYYTPESE